MTLFICSLPNPGTKGPVRELFYSDNAAGIKRAEDFVKKENGQPGRGLYFCIGKLCDGAKERNRKTVAELGRIVVDLDLKNIEEPRERVLEVVKKLQPQPNEIRDSGWGLHVEWLLKEAAANGSLAHAEIIMGRLVKLLAGDPKPTHRESLLRLPGTINTKNNEQRECHAIWKSDAGAVDISEFDRIFDLYGDRSLLTQKKTQSKTNGHAASSDGSGEYVDVEQRLANMRYEGAGKGSIHETKLDCTGSLLNDGNSVESVVDKVLGAVRHRMKGDARAANWDWDWECYDTELMCYGLINKDPGLAPTLPDELFAAWSIQLDAGNPSPQIAYNEARKRWYLEPFVAAEKPPPTWPTPYSARPSSSIPRRKWLWGTHYYRGGVTITAAPGATGKSQHSLVEAVGMAAARDLITGEIKKQRLKVWVWNAEDDVDEMERRIAGICDYYSIDRESLRGWLFVDDGFAVPLEFAAGGKVAIIKEAILKQVADRVRALGIDVVIFDPLVALHTLPEQDNTNLAKVIRALGKLAHECNCAIELVHHTRKASKGDDSGLVTDDVRGAGTIIYTPRSGRLMHPMSGAEAEKYGVDGEDRFSYVRLERAKPNMARRGTIYWLQLVAHTIDNAGDDEPGDTVTVPALWSPIDVTDKITDVISAAIRTATGKGEFRRDMRAGNDWAGRVVGKLCNLDLSKRAGRTQAESILCKLIAKGVLATEFRTDHKTRKTREYVVPGVPS